MNMMGKHVDHLLLHCTIVRELWNLFFVIFGIKWVMPKAEREGFFVAGAELGSRI